MKRYILKQNGNAPKSLSHMAKFEDNSDLLYHLKELKKSWNESQYGEVDFDLMQVVEGVEVAASAFFNGHDWLRNSKGKIVSFLNFEFKKEADGDMGETTGETGTVFFGCDEDNEIAKDILFRPEITALLKKTNYRGVFDINGCLTDDGFVAFEPTSRFGVPATSYEFMNGLKTKTADLLEAMADGLDTPVEINTGWGMCMVISAKPYPVEADMDDASTSIGEKLWILSEGKPAEEFSREQWKNIHLENFYCTEEGDYKVATKCGYLLVVCARGSSIKATREKLIHYIKDNIYLSGMKFRTDIGERIEGEI